MQRRNAAAWPDPFVGGGGRSDLNGAPAFLADNVCRNGF